jgi:hypothetical protein
VPFPFGSVPNRSYPRRAWLSPKKREGGPCAALTRDPGLNPVRAK